MTWKSITTVRSVESACGVSSFRARTARRRREGRIPQAFTLVEMLIAIGIVAILASVVVPELNTAGSQKLEAVARILASDLGYARNLAIQYNTQWSVQVDLTNNAYNLVYAGSGAQPVTLVNARGNGDAASTTYRVNVGNLGESTIGSNGVTLAGCALQGTQANITTVTFGPMGSLGPTQTQDTVIWLTSGSGATAAYVKLTVSWVTGQTWFTPTQMYTTRSQVFQ